MKIWPKHINQSGDTIVEVVIAVAIISSVLVGAFLVSQKSTLAVRDSQEHGEMLQILQGQVDLVSAMAQAEKSPTAGIFATSPASSKYFCIKAADPAHLTRVDFPSNFELPTASSDPFDKYPTECKNIDSRYNVAISYDATKHVFSFYGRWDRLGGEKNEAKMAYRAYAGQEPVAVAPSAGIPISPAGGLNGSANAVPLHCLNPNPVTGLCPSNPNPKKPQYYFDQTYTNDSVVPAGLTVVGCAWDWGDGTKPDTKWCNPGDIAEHLYSMPGLLPYPAACGMDPFTLVLTLHLSDGTLAIKDAVRVITPKPVAPKCY